MPNSPKISIIIIDHLSYFILRSNLSSAANTNTHSSTLKQAPKGTCLEDDETLQGHLFWLSQTDNTFHTDSVAPILVSPTHQAGLYNSNLLIMSHNHRVSCESKKELIMPFPLVSKMHSDGFIWKVGHKHWHTEFIICI